MLQNPRGDVRACYEHAEWCADQAKTTVNEQTREDFLRLAQRWLKLARSVERDATARPDAVTAKDGTWRSTWCSKTANKHKDKISVVGR
jgi:hypothetical protein